MTDEPITSEELQLQHHHGSDSGDDNDAAAAAASTVGAAAARDKSDSGNNDDDNSGGHSHQHQQQNQQLQRREYDVVIVGTGLVQSILACALTRQGRSVLHVDGERYYGEHDASWTLPYLVESLVPLLDGTRERGAPAITTADNSKQQGGGDSGDDSGDETVIQLSRQGAVLNGLRLHGHSDVMMKDVGTKDSCTKGDRTATTSQQAAPAPAAAVDAATAASADQETPATPAATAAPPTATTTGVEPEEEGGDLLKDRQLLHDILTSRAFALDVTPQCLFCHGPAVAGLLESNVSDYLEFKSMKGIYYYHIGDDKTTKAKSKLTAPATSRMPGSSSGSDGGSGSDGTFVKVPCNKNDIFTSQLFSPMDKRRLMRFLQLAMDYAILKSTEGEQKEATGSSSEQQQQQQHEQGLSGEEEDPDSDNTAAAASTVAPSTSDQAMNNTADNVQSYNEKQLNTGRSLGRPQNKSVATDDLAVLQETYIAAHRSFAEYLTNEHKLSSRLSELVRYAFTLLLSSSSSSQITPPQQQEQQEENEMTPPRTISHDLSCERGMNVLAAHMASLGKFLGATSGLLFPMFGAGELSQAFCRNAAVFGATYILHQYAPISIHARPTTKATGVEACNDAKNNKRHNVVLVKNRGNGDDDSNDEREQPQQTSMTVSCEHVIVSRDSIVEQASVVVEQQVQVQLTGGCHNHRRRVLRRMSILRGKPSFDQDNRDAPADDQQQRYVLIIPPHALDSEAKATETPCYHDYPIHVMLLDESVQVSHADHTVLHITTIVCVDDDGTDNAQEEQLWPRLLEKVVDVVLSGSKRKGKLSQKPPQEDEENENENEPQSKASVNEIFHLDYSYPLYDDNIDEGDRVNSYDGQHVICKQEPHIVMDHVFEQAECVFRRICGPHAKFLALSKVMQDTITANLGQSGAGGSRNHNMMDGDEEHMALQSAMDIMKRQQNEGKDGNDGSQL